MKPILHLVLNPDFFGHHFNELSALDPKQAKANIIAKLSKAFGYGEDYSSFTTEFAGWGKCEIGTEDITLIFSDPGFLKLNASTAPANIDKALRNWAVNSLAGCTTQPEQLRAHSLIIGTNIGEFHTTPHHHGS